MELQELAKQIEANLKTSMQVDFEKYGKDIESSIKKLEKLQIRIIKLQGSENKTTKKNVFKGKELQENELKTIAFEAYKLLQNLSMFFRNNILQEESEKYNNITYALYYKGKRFFVDQLDKEWISIQADGSIQISLAKVKKAFDKKIMDNTISNKTNALLQLFTEHYKQFLPQAERLSQNKQTRLDKKGINKGHIAEAFERHLAEHHKELYIKSKNSKLQENIEEDKDYMVLKNYIEKTSTRSRSWYKHEEGENKNKQKRTMIKHLYHSLGSQRGTAAGDVFNVQVKQIREDYYDKKKHKVVRSSTTIQLSSLSNLITGLKIYSRIFSKENLSRTAKLIALYLTDAIDSNLSMEINKEIIPQVLKDEIQLDEWFDKNKNIKLHM